MEYSVPLPLGEGLLAGYGGLTSGKCQQAKKVVGASQKMVVSVHCDVHCRHG